MKNDKAVYLLVKQIQDKANSFVNYVDAFNQCAMTDRQVEDIIDAAKKLAKAYGEQFAEPYNHIKDCWKVLEEVATVKQVEDLFETFPKWSGYWSWTIVNSRFFVTNEYFDKDADCYEEDTRELDNILDWEDYEEDK